jgi:hypothetical protein
MHRPPIIVIVVAGISSPANVLQMEVSLLCVWGKLEIAKRSLGINRPFEVLELDFSGYPTYRDLSVPERGSTSDYN